MSVPLLRADRAVAYSPLSFLGGVGTALGDHVQGALAAGVASGTIGVVGAAARWYWRQLTWDSQYFGLPMVRFEAATWDDGVADPAAELARSAGGFLAELDAREGRHYVFAELPTEDLAPLQALGMAGFRLIETRLGWFTTDVRRAILRDRFPVRPATNVDIPHLREVAATARNPYDRYHADPFFGEAVADTYLATYAEASVRELAAAVLVPDPADGDPPGALFTTTISTSPECPVGLDHDCSLGLTVGRIPLVAVGPRRRGWHMRLLSETGHWFAERQVDVACMTSQAANRAVTHNCEKLGYRLGRVTHVLSRGRGEDP